MTRDGELVEQARAREMAPVSEGLWESVQVWEPELGVPQRVGRDDVVMTPIADHGRHRVGPGDVERYFFPLLASMQGFWCRRTLWRDATAQEREELLAREAQQDRELAASRRLFDVWAGIKARFVEGGKAFPERLCPEGEMVVAVVDTRWGDYCVVLDEARWMWWVHIEPVAEEQQRRGVRGPATAYRLRWDAELAALIRSTPQMPDHTLSFPVEHVLPPR